MLDDLNISGMFWQSAIFSAGHLCRFVSISTYAILAPALEITVHIFLRLTLLRCGNLIYVY
jgi:hypothetical protein